MSYSTRPRAAILISAVVTLTLTGAVPAAGAQRRDDNACATAGCLGGQALPPPVPEKVVQHVVPLPASITSVTFPGYTADGSRILAAATSTGFTGTQLVSFTEDGTDVRCLTCGTGNGADVLKPFAFPDGRRVLIRLGAQSPSSPADHGVVECAPSVLDCREATIVPIVPPSADDPNVVQDQRELRVAPDGVHVALSQIRRTAGGLPSGVGIVGRLVRHGDAYQVEDARAVAEGSGELKGFTPDGQQITYTRFLNAFEAGNPDDVTVDLRTGSEKRATTALDWDEDIDFSPYHAQGRCWMVVGSGRGAGLLETVSQVRRPTLIEAGLSSLPFSVFNQPQVAEPWLVDEFDARGDYLGQPLAPGAVAGGWNSRANFTWKPDGTAVIFGQQQIGGTKSRVVLARLPQRKPGRAVTGPATPTPGWAPPLAGYVPADPMPPKPLDGKVSGRAEVSLRPSPVPDYDFVIEVAYTNFADEPGFVIDGVERSYFDRPGVNGADSLYSADLVVSGGHTGYLKADNVLIRPNAIRGTIESRVDDRHLTLGPLP
ncbi:hypothetical protein ACTWPT_06555 [Nonomuraea sp. 3N208]|uniref:hypothetical protein n=1 Tax=Nonomuraea sp. 3N208 TaxID=3457421 RepID=UPI003FCDDD51